MTKSVAGVVLPIPSRRGVEIGGKRNWRLCLCRTRRPAKTHGHHGDVLACPRVRLLGRYRHALRASLLLRLAVPWWGTRNSIFSPWSTSPIHTAAFFSSVVGRKPAADKMAVMGFLPRGSNGDPISMSTSPVRESDDLQGKIQDFGICEYCW